jgi:metal-responsive CopG/Arc/MetJ family transcriptional regulator
MKQPRPKRTRPTSSGKTPKSDNAKTTSIAIKPEFLKKVDAVAKHEDVDRSRSQLVNRALKYYFKHELSDIIDELGIVI